MMGAEGRRAVACLVLVGAVLLAAPHARAAEPTAHDPQFSDKSLWPKLGGKEAFVSQKWPAARVLTWANPGRSGGAPASGGGGSGRSAKVAPEALDPANWLENGKPASAPPDSQTDIVLPASDKEYTVRLDTVRHMTIERNATLVASEIAGNLWIKSGGRFDSAGRTAKITGERHTFLRNDNQPPDPAANRDLPWKKASWRMMIGYDIVVKKRKDSSTEFLGIIRAGDELVVWEGIAIVGEDSTLRPGAPSTQLIGAEGVLQLQSGAYFGKEACGGGPVDIHVQGKILAGTPERPLTRDAVLGVSCPRIYTDQRGEHQMGQYGLLVEPKARLSVSSADPTKARLVLKWNEGVRGSVTSRKINLTLLGTLDLNGVMFDQVAKGGIRLPDPSVRSRWKNVFFGNGNDGAPDELFSRFDEQVPAVQVQGAGFVK